MSKFPNNVGKINPADMWFLLRLIPPWWSLMMPIQAHLQYRISRRFICKKNIYEIFIECLISIAWDHCNKFSKQISISDPCQTMWIPCLAGGVWCRCCDRPRQTFSHLSRAKLFILFGNTWNDFPRFQLVSLVQRHTHSYTLMHAGVIKVRNFPMRALDWFRMVDASRCHVHMYVLYIYIYTHNFVEVSSKQDILSKTYYTSRSLVHVN